MNRPPSQIGPNGWISSPVSPGFRPRSLTPIWRLQSSGRSGPSRCSIRARRPFLISTPFWQKTRPRKGLVQTAKTALRRVFLGRQFPPSRAGLFPPRPKPAASSHPPRAETPKNGAFRGGNGGNSANARRRPNAHFTGLTEDARSHPSPVWAVLGDRGPTAPDQAPEGPIHWFFDDFSRRGPQDPGYSRRVPGPYSETGYSRHTI